MYILIRFWNVIVSLSYCEVIIPSSLIIIVSELESTNLIYIDFTSLLCWFVPIFMPHCNKIIQHSKKKSFNTYLSIGTNYNIYYWRANTAFPALSKNTVIYITHANKRNIFIVIAFSLRAIIDGKSTVRYIVWSLTTNHSTQLSHHLAGSWPNFLQRTMYILHSARTSLLCFESSTNAN